MGGAQINSGTDACCPAGANGKIARTRWKYAPNKPTTMLAMKTRFARITARPLLRKDSIPARSSTNPAAGLKRMGTHSFVGIVLLTTFVEYVSTPNSRKFQDSMSIITWSRKTGRESFESTEIWRLNGTWCYSNPASDRFCSAISLSSARECSTS